VQDELVQSLSVAPHCLYKLSYTNTVGFLFELIFEIGPVLIMLDDYMFPFKFQYKNELEKCYLFLSYCDVVLRQWVCVPGLFCLILGQSLFLNYVGPQSLEMPSVGPLLTCELLSLQFLRPNAI
jgi:hypothetical protein